MLANGGPLPIAKSLVALLCTFLGQMPFSALSLSPHQRRRAQISLCGHARAICDGHLHRWSVAVKSDRHIAPWQRREFFFSSCWCTFWVRTCPKDGQQLNKYTFTDWPALYECRGEKRPYIRLSSWAYWLPLVIIPPRALDAYRHQTAAARHFALAAWI